jgi:cyclopropane fatty-acyl-phospholipid synthase-like methyltransferase
LGSRITMTEKSKPDSDELAKTYQLMVERYESGRVPWDSELPPPEVIDLMDAEPPGCALDLGCGYGRASIYLAQHGWQVDAVDFVPEAVREATKRARAANVGDRISFHVASVTDLSFLAGPYAFALDVGCLHVLSERGRQAYHKELLRLLPPGASFLLFARLRETGEEVDPDPPGLTEAGILALFTDGFDLTRSELGETHMDDQSSWASAWFWFRRS